MYLALLRGLRRLLPARARARLRLAMFDWLDIAWGLPSGVLVRLHSYDEWIVYNSVFVDGEYDEAIRMAMELADPDRPLRVLDLGAHVGFFGLRVVDLLRRRRADELGFDLTLVEGDPATLNRLRSNLLEANHLADRCTVVHGLVGKRAGVAVLRRGERSGTSSTVGPAGAPGVAVPYVDLSQWVPEGATIDLLKCDIEGAELSLLENYPDLLQKVRVAVFELHDLLCGTRRCRDLLRQASFAHHRVVREVPPNSVLYVWR